MIRLLFFYPLTLLTIISSIKPTSQSSFSFASLFGLTERPLSNAFATQSGIVPIHRDDYGFYVNVDLAAHSSDASDEVPSPDTVPMMLGLYTPRTLMASNCMNFTSYDCSSLRCDPMNRHLVSYNFIDFGVEGYEASALAYLDYNYWSLIEFSLLAQDCFTFSTVSLGTSRNGIIGMGTSQNAFNNYDDGIAFSVSLDQNMAGGNLTFFDAPLANPRPNTIEYSFLTTLDWQIIGADNRIGVGDWSFEFIGQIVVDLNRDMISFPYDIYYQITNLLWEQASLYCSGSAYRPQCSYYGALSDLPNIEFEIQNQTLLISPQLYILNWTNSTDVVNNEVTLNLCGTASYMSDETFVTPDYDGYVILGSNFMSQYFTVFNTSMGGLMIILCNSDPRVDYTGDDAYSNPKWVIVVFSIVLLVIVIIVVWCCTRYFKGRKRSKLVHSEEMQESGKEPLIK